MTAKLIKLDISQLSLIELDYVIAVNERDEHKFWPVIINGKVFLDTDFDHIEYSPTTNWAIGGELIAKYQVGFIGSDGAWIAQTKNEFDSFSSALGDTHLIAAMRAIIKAKIGKVVEIPYVIHESLVGTFVAEIDAGIV